jgi:hypothetical protein
MLFPLEAGYQISRQIVCQPVVLKFGKILRSSAVFHAHFLGRHGADLGSTVAEPLGRRLQSWLTLAKTQAKFLVGVTHSTHRNVN